MKMLTQSISSEEKIKLILPLNKSMVSYMTGMYFSHGSYQDSCLSNYARIVVYHTSNARWAKKVQGGLQMKNGGIPAKLAGLGSGSASSTPDVAPLPTRAASTAFAEAVCCIRNFLGNHKCRNA